MKLQVPKRLIQEDFSEKDRPLISKLAYVVNSAFDDLSRALSNNLSIEDNLNIAKKDLTVSVDSSGTPTSKTQLPTGLDHNCQGIQVIRAVNTTTGSTVLPTGTPFITFQESNKVLTISNITNLPSSVKWQLKVILY